MIFFSQLHRGTLEALDYARSIASEIVAIHVDIGDTDKTNLQQQWQQLDSPYRSIIAPMSEFVADFESQHPGRFTTVIIPVFVTRHWWEDFLHNQTALFIRVALRSKRSRVISNVRYYL